MAHRFNQTEYDNRVRVTPAQVQAKLENLGKITVGRLIIAEDLSATEIDSISGLFPAWAVGAAVKVSDIMRYESSLYKCVQAHTTQGDWTPDTTPALWVKVSAPGTIPAWVQPTGAHDAYAIDDMVTHDGQTWKSTIAANTTVPGENTAFGWWVEVAE